MSSLEEMKKFILENIDNNLKRGVVLSNEEPFSSKWSRDSSKTTLKEDRIYSKK